MRSLERLPGPFRETPAEDIRQRLRELPKDTQPPYDWDEFRRRERRRRVPRQSVKWEHAAAAAGITVLIASMAMWGRSDHPHADISSSGIASAPLAANSPASNGIEGTNTTEASNPDATARNTTETMNARNEAANAWANAVVRDRAAKASKAAQAEVAFQFAALATPESERWLEQQPAEPAVMRVGQRLAVANLEDRIAWVDDALSDAQFTAAGTAGLKALHLQRARLVSSLAQVRYAETLAQLP